MNLIPDELAGTGLSGWLGAVIASLIGGGFVLRRWLSRDAVERAGDRAEVNIIETLTVQLAAANARADLFASERNGAIREIGELKAQIERLNARVEIMQQQLERMHGEPVPPVS
ncbi:hypothetical protein ANDA3_3066 [plant metagenome]|uniref:Chemotaxis protein n=1 Tax=plant metagenome TaxID=1297885 RepID=A0A484QYM5_9ZZZZ